MSDILCELEADPSMGGWTALSWIKKTYIDCAENVSFLTFELLTGSNLLEIVKE
jgi:hypothetical protein